MKNESLGKSFYSLSFNFQKVSNSLTFSQSIKQSIKYIYLFITFQNLEFWDFTPASVASSTPSSHHRADGTLPQSSARSEFVGCHQAERMLNSEVPYVRYMDRSDREDVQLHQPCCASASACGLRGYVDDTLPSRCYASP